MPQGAPEPEALVESLDRILRELAGEERSAALRTLLAEIRPEDVAEVLGHYPDEEKREIFRALPEHAHPQVIDETDWDTTRAIVAELSPPELGRIVEQMPPDEATDLVADLEEEDRRELFEELEPETAGEVRRLLQHHPESAGGIMTSDFIAVGPERTAAEVLEQLQSTLDTEVVAYVYVVAADGRLLGVCSIRDLLRASPDAPIGGFMTAEPIRAEIDDDQEKVAMLARKYNLKSIPVVDKEGRLVGLATIDDILDILAEEAEEDIYRMAGMTDAYPAQQRMLRRALVRLPWLLFPVISGLVIVSLQQDGERPGALGEQLALFAFIPLVNGIAGAVGTQTATMMVRGIATGQFEGGRRRRVVFREFAIGWILALSIGGLVGGLLALVGGADPLAPAVALGLAGGILIASLSGTLIPLGCETIGLDPALVAGPFITSFNDVVAATAYLGIAELVLLGTP